MFDARSPNGDDVEQVDQLVMLYEDERAGFEKLVAHLVAEVPEALAHEGVTLDAHRARVTKWREIYLAESERGATDLETKILQLARHVGQRGAARSSSASRFETLTTLDAIAARHIKSLVRVQSHLNSRNKSPGGTFTSFRFSVLPMSP